MADTDSLETMSEGDKQLTELARGLANDPKTRKAFLALIKAKHPETPIPELDNAADMARAIAPHLEKIGAMEKKLLERDAEKNISDRRQTLKDEGFGADDIKAIEEMMVKEQIPNYASAAEFYKLRKQTSQPTPSTMLQTKLPLDKKTVVEAGGIKNWARAEAGKAFDEIRAGRVKLH